MSDASDDLWIETDRVAQSELQCASCAGQCVYSPYDEALKCTQCGTTRDLSTPDDHEAARERDHVWGDDPPVKLEAVTHHCETCGGDVVFTGPVLSKRCAYCDGPVVLRQADTGYETMGLIPFRVAEERAQVLAQEWVGRRLAAPNDLAEVVARGRVAGVYAPFWTFDTDEFVQYTAKVGERRGDDTKWRVVSGQMNTSFDDLLVPASRHVTPLIRDGILHEFKPERLRPYRPGYLSGFAAERHHQSVSQGLAAGEEDKQLLIRNRIKRHIGRGAVKDIAFKTDTSGIRYRRILLPVWILHYEYGGEPMKVVVCGFQGKTFGERPFSRSKLFAYSAALSAAAMAIGLFWGAAGLL